MGQQVTYSKPMMTLFGNTWPASVGDELTHWGRVTHICVIKLNTIGSDNGLLSGQHQPIIQTNAGILLIGTLGTNFSEMSIEMHTFSLKKLRLKMSSGKWQPFVSSSMCWYFREPWSFFPCSKYKKVLKAGIILWLCPANERRRYIVTSSLIGWAHTQNEPWKGSLHFLVQNRTLLSDRVGHHTDPTFQFGWRPATMIVLWPTLNNHDDFKGAIIWRINICWIHQDGGMKFLGNKLSARQPRPSLPLSMELWSKLCLLILAGSELKLTFPTNHFASLYLECHGRSLVKVNNIQHFWALCLNTHMKLA